MLYQRKPKTNVIVDLSPLIDVVFLLLIFFMVSTTFKDSHGMDLQLPEASSETSSDEDQLSLSIGKDGSVALQGEVIDQARIQEQLATLLQSREDKMVVMRVDAAVSHGLVVEVMDLAKTAGAQGITFAAKAKSNP